MGGSLVEERRCLGEGRRVTSVGEAIKTGRASSRSLLVLLGINTGYFPSTAPVPNTGVAAGAGVNWCGLWTS